MASVLTITEAKGSAKFLIKKKYCEPMALVIADPRQKSHLYGSGPFATEGEKCLYGLG